MRQSQIRILQLASGDLWAGAEVQLFNLCQDLHRRDGVSVIVVLLNDGELLTRLQQAGIRVILLDETVLGGLKILSKLTGIFREHKPHIVHTHRQKENVIGSLACLFAGRLPSLRTVHGAPEFHFKPWQIHKHLFRFLDRFSGRYLQRRLVCVSADLYEILSDYYPQKRLCIIENGINVDYITAQSKEQAVLPAGAAATRFGIVARLVPVKRIDLFIEMARQILTDNKDISFYIFGDGPLRDRLTTMAEEYPENIVFMGFKNNILPFVRQMSMIFITSDHEGLPMNLLEAMCLKVPVTAHATGGIPGVLADGACGTLVPEQTGQAYAQAATAYLADPAPFLEKAELGYERISSRYSAASMGNTYIELYSDILGDQ